MVQFQSTLPIRGATARPLVYLHPAVFQSTLPLRGATGLQSPYGADSDNFNPHSPYRERRMTEITDFSYQVFQSTLPIRGATFYTTDGVLWMDISIHTPHTGSDWGLGRVMVSILISIHTPHTGSDFFRQRQSSGSRSNFNPHSPYGERREDILQIMCSALISIHTPHTGSDLGGNTADIFQSNFNPHSPYGERLSLSDNMDSVTMISIHTPHTGSDGGNGRIQLSGSQFQSTLPIRGATWSEEFDKLAKNNFNPHSPYGERRCICQITER